MSAIFRRETFQIPQTPMKKKCRSFRWLIVALALLLVGALWLRKQMEAAVPTIHPAMAGPVTGPSATIGRSYIQAIRLAFDEVNAVGGIDGHRVTLDIFDDQNRPDLAAEMARKIADDSRILGLIGRQFSQCSLAAGEICRERGVPAIPPGSTNVRPTRDNEWYFRTVFNDQLQGHFVANYARKIFAERRLSVISPATAPAEPTWAYSAGATSSRRSPKSSRSTISSGFPGSNRRCGTGASCRSTVGKRTRPTPSARTRPAAGAQGAFPEPVRPHPAVLRLG